MADFSVVLFIFLTLVLVMTRWQIQTSKQSKHVRYLGQSSEQMKNRLEVIPYNPMIAHPTQIFQATREARLISEDVETPSVEDEGLGAEEVLLVTITKFTTSTKFTDTLFMKRLFCHKINISLISCPLQAFPMRKSESSKFLNFFLFVLCSLVCFQNLFKFKESLLCW